MLDLLDAPSVRRAFLWSRPDAVVNEATALADVNFSRSLDRSFVVTNRLRREGTDTLLAAAREAGVPRVVAQSFANFRYARVGGPVKREDDPLDPIPVAGMRDTAAAMNYLDDAVTAAGGVVLRYGIFYGADNDGLLRPSASGSSRSSATAPVSCRSSTWTTRRRRRCSRSSTTGRRSTTSSTTSPARRASGCPGSRRRSAPSRPAASPSGSPGSSPALPR